MNNVYRRLRSARGFSLTDMIATMAIIATVSAMAVPQAVGILEQYKLGMAARDVERELQFAKLKAVSTNRPMRVRFDCPASGQLRVVELIGSPSAPDPDDADSMSNRCNETLYPYSPAGSAAKSRLARPNNDGPIRRLQDSTTFAAKMTLEFWPDGSVHADAGTGNPWPNIGATGKTLTMYRKGKTKNIMVNGFGKILMDR
jgi:hypothetical protein